MKNILLLMLVAIGIVSCGKQEDDLPLNKIEEETFTEEDWYNTTGCKPTGAKDIKTYKLYKDKDSTKYLYGSKYKDGVESFWFAKYSSSGEQQWEIIHKDAQFASHAYNPVQIANGDIVVNNVTKEEPLTVKGASPVIIDKEGKANYVNMPEHYYYTDVSVFDDFFFTIVNQYEAVYPNLTHRAVQINNKGEVIRLFPDGILYLPRKDDKFIWLTDSTYASMNLKSIQNCFITDVIRDGFITDMKWKTLVNIPSHISCEMSLLETDTTVIASYALEYEDGVKDTIIYDLYKETGKEVWRPIPLENISFSENEKTITMGESFIIHTVFIPENATNKNLTWSSSDNTIATVDQNGKVSSISCGECLITAISEDGGSKAICRLTVLDPPIEEAIRVSVYGSSTSINGLTNADVTAAFYNNSSRIVKVISFTMYDSRTQKAVFQEKDCGFVKYRQPLQYNLVFERVYKPVYVWIYEYEGKIYEIKDGAVM